MRRSIAMLALLGCMDYSITGGQPPQDVPDEHEAPLGPAILVEPLVLDFGAVKRGDRATLPVTVTNIGDAPLQLVQFLAPESWEVRLGAMPLEPLAPGQSEPIEVTWSPTTFDPLDDAFGLDHEAANTGIVQVALVGQVLAPAVTVDPAHHDFGVVERGTAADLTVTIGNASDDVLRVEELLYHTTSASGELSLHDVGLFGALPVTLPPGASAPVTVRFAPTTDIAAEGRLTVLSDDPSAPEVVATQDAVGTPGRDYEVEISITADDAWEGWLDGTPLPGINRNDWQRRDTTTFRLSSGEHVLAIHAFDVARAVAGMIAYVKVDGDPWYATGAADYRVSAMRPPSDWTDPGFDASAWPVASRCDGSSAAVWGTYWPAPFYDVGASWIWSTTNCRALGEAWFRLEIALP